jgi:hypothetical protein
MSELRNRIGMGLIVSGIACWLAAVAFQLV